MYQKLYQYEDYFLDSKKNKRNIDEQTITNFLEDFKEFMIYDYEEIIGEFCHDNEGWYDIGGLKECLDEMYLDELVAILSSIIIENKYLKNLLLAEINSGFIGELLKYIRKMDK